MVAFEVHGRPQPAGSKRGFARGGRVIIVDANPASRPWKTIVADAARQAHTGAPWRGPTIVTIDFYVTRPKAHINARGEVKPSAPRKPTTRPDLLKLARAIEDALTGVLWHDDAQIVHETLAKHYTTEGAHVTVTAVELAE